MSALQSIKSGELGRVLFGFRRELGWAFVFSLFVNLLVLTPTLYLMQVYDRVLLSGSLYTLAAISIIALLFFLVMGFAEWVRARLIVRAGAHLDAQLHQRVFDASFETALGGTGTGKSVQGFSDLTQLRQFLTGAGLFAVLDTPWTVVYIGVLYLMHPWLGLLALAFSVVMLSVAVLGSRMSTQRFARVSEAQIEGNAFLHARLRNAETVEALGMRGNFTQQWLALQARLAPLNREAHDASQHMQGAVKFLQHLQQSLMLAVAAWLAIDGRISAGAMIACNALMGNALRPIGLLVQSWRGFVDSKQAFKRLDGLLTSFPARRVEPTDERLRSDVVLKGLSAQSPGGNKVILNGLDLEVAAGEVVGIVGPSGAGKSTLARCLVGIWPKTDGQVLLGGRAVEQWSREVLGRQVGYLPQDIELFDGTIAENISRFQSVPPEVVVEAAQKAGIHDMVLRLPKGYDTPLGEAGHLLSAGQRQRIGLARALLGRPTLVVLDEPNANLDDLGEQALVKAVQELKKAGATVFMIVHQKNLLAVADRVLTLENGLIARSQRVAVAIAAPREGNQP